MAKAIKNLKSQHITSPHQNFLSQFREKITSLYSMFLLGTLLIVFFVYLFSLFRPWLPFDERLIYQETLFPIPTSFSEMYEIIRTFVINSHVESMNIFFSNYVTIRSNLFSESLVV